MPALNTKSNSIASLKTLYHPVRPSNATDAATVAAQATVHYNSTKNVVDAYGMKIPKVGTKFYPRTLDNITILEYLVTRKDIVKT